MPRTPRARWAVAIVMAVTLLVGGCAHDVHARFPSAGDAATGSLVLVFTQPSPDVYVAIDGVLVVDGAHTSRIVVAAVPSGYADVTIAMGAGEKTVRVWIDDGRDTVLPVGSPGVSATDSIRNMAMSLAAVALYAWIR